MSRVPALERPVVLGLATIVATALVVVLGMTGVITSLLSGTETRRVQAVFADAQQLRAGSDVRLGGIRVGEVAGVALAPDGRTATVTMDVEEDAGSLYRDAGAVLRWKSLLGGSFYVDLERGSAARGQLQGPIAVARTARQAELEDVVGVFRDRAVRGLQTLPRELADAFEDERAPAAALDEVARQAPALRDGLRALRGRRLDRDLRVLVAQAARTTDALSRPTGALRTVVSGAAATLRTTAARRDDLRALLARSPRVQAEMRRTFARLETTLDLADPLVAALDQPAARVAPALAALRPGVADGARLVRRAVPLLRDLRPAVAALAGAAARGGPFLRDLEPSVQRLDRTILPYVNEIDPQTQRSTAVMIGGTFTGLGSGAPGQMDENGHFIRFPASSGSSPVATLPCQVYINNPDAAQIAACNSLQDALQAFLTYQPLAPTPGTDPGNGGGG